MKTYIKTPNHQDENGRNIFLLVVPTAELYSIAHLMESIVKSNGIENRLLVLSN